MTYKDAQGNEYRKNGEEWQVLVKGRGWQRYDGTAYVTVLADGDFVPTVIPPAARTIAPEQAEKEAVKRNRENELFVHVAVEAMKETLRAGHDGYNENSVATAACEQAQAMIDELKSRNRI